MVLVVSLEFAGVGARWLSRNKEVSRVEGAAQRKPLCGFCLCHPQQHAWHAANFTGFDFSRITAVFSGGNRKTKSALR